MIIVSIYPEQLFDTSLSQCTYHNSIIDRLPKQVILHIFPFLESCGDGGYAISDWYSVDRSFGTWDTIVTLARKRLVLIDGVFNHVGKNHNLVKSFINEPNKYSEYFFVNKGLDLKSPRGQDANLPMLTSAGIKYVRQTHMDMTVDIDLENPHVICLLEDYLDFLKTKSIWGIRLDAVAYYKKGRLIRHNEGSKSLANDIADMVSKKGFYVIAQVDSDEQGREYFSDNEHRFIPIFDFSYSAILLYTLITKNANTLVNHLKKLQEYQRLYIRAPRTHDGILLRGGNLPSECISAITEFSVRNGIEVRYSNGTVYEINSSWPWLMYLLDSDYYNLILLTIAFTCLTDCIPYLYYPLLVGYMPEMCEDLQYGEKFPKADPRSLNRISINKDVRLNNTFIDSVVELLEKIAIIRNECEEGLQNGDIQYELLDTSIVKIAICENKYVGFYNFSSVPYKLDKTYIQDKEVIIGAFSGNYYLDKYSFMVFEEDKK